jgi:hypothetical protein
MAAGSGRVFSVSVMCGHTSIDSDRAAYSILYEFRDEKPATRSITDQSASKSPWHFFRGRTQFLGGG